MASVRRYSATAPAQAGTVFRAQRAAAMQGKDMQGALGRRMKLSDALEKLKRVK